MKFRAIPESIKETYELDMRCIAHIHDLHKQLESTSNHCLTRNDSSQDGNNQTEVKASWWNSIEERVCVCSSSSILSDVCSLANIGEQQRRERQAQPGELNSSLAESSQVCEQSFNSSESKKQTSEGSPALFSIAYQVLPREIWAESLQNAVIELG